MELRLVLLHQISHIIVSLFRCAGVFSSHNDLLVTELTLALLQIKNIGLSLMYHLLQLLLPEFLLQLLQNTVTVAFVLVTEVVIHTPAKQNLPLPL